MFCIIKCKNVFALGYTVYTGVNEARLLAELSSSNVREIRSIHFNRHAYCTLRFCSTRRLKAEYKNNACVPVAWLSCFFVSSMHTEQTSVTILLHATGALIS